MSEHSQHQILHQTSAFRLLTLIVMIFGALAFVCVLSGGAAVLMNRGAQTTFTLFGAKCTTASVGVALVGFGLITAYLVVKAVLNILSKQSGKRR
jgi:hypothetical protein